MKKICSLQTIGMDQLKKQHDPVYQLKIQQGEIREKRSIGTLPYPTKKKANYRVH